MSIIVLCGIHSAGKTSLGHFLQSRGYQFYDEMAKIENVNPWELPATGDREIFDNEFARDRMILLNNRDVIIETWHIGNMAYSSVRNPLVAKEYHRRVAEQIQKHKPIVINLDISTKTMMVRSDVFAEKFFIQKKASAFYSSVKGSLLRLVDEMNIPQHTIDANKSIDSVFEQVTAILKRINAVDCEDL